MGWCNREQKGCFLLKILQRKNKYPYVYTDTHTHKYTNMWVNSSKSSETSESTSLEYRTQTTDREKSFVVFTCAAGLVRDILASTEHSQMLKISVCFFDGFSKSKNTLKHHPEPNTLTEKNCCFCLNTWCSGDFTTLNQDTGVMCCDLDSAGTVELYKVITLGKLQGLTLRI